MAVEGCDTSLQSGEIFTEGHCWDKTKPLYVHKRLSLVSEKLSTQAYSCCSAQMSRMLTLHTQTTANQSEE